MTITREVNLGLNSAYELSGDVLKTRMEAPLLLLVKEAVLDILGYNNEKYNNTIINDLPENIQNVVKYNDIDLILSELKSDEQKAEFMKKFRNNPESVLLNTAGFYKEEPITFYETAITSNIKKGLYPNWQPLYNIGITLFESGKEQEAITYFEGSLNDDSIPEDVKFYASINLGYCYSYVGDIEKSNIFLKNILKENKNNQYVGHIYYYLGKNFFFLKNNKEAIKYLKKVLKEYSDTEFKNTAQYYEAMGILSECYTSLGNIKESNKIINKILENSKNIDESLLVNIYRTLGKNYTLLGEELNVRKYLYEATICETINSSNPYIYYNIGASFAREGNNEKAFEYMCGAINMIDFNDIYLIEVIIKSLFKIGKDDFAFSFLGDLFSNNKINAENKKKILQNINI